MPLVSKFVDTHFVGGVYCATAKIQRDVRFVTLPYTTLTLPRFLLKRSVKRTIIFSYSNFPGIITVKMYRYPGIATESKTRDKPNSQLWPVMFLFSAYQRTSFMCS